MQCKYAIFYDFILLSSDRLVTIIAIYLSLGSLWLFLLNFCHADLPWMLPFAHCLYSSQCSLFVVLCSHTLSLSCVFSFAAWVVSFNTFVWVSVGVVVVFSLSFLSLTLWCPLLSPYTHTLSRTFRTVSLTQKHKHSLMQRIFLQVFYCIAIVSLISLLLFFHVPSLLVFMFWLFCPSSSSSSSRSFFSFFLCYFTGFCILKNFGFCLMLLLSLFFFLFVCALCVSSSINFMVGNNVICQNGQYSKIMNGRVKMPFSFMALNIFKFVLHVSFRWMEKMSKFVKTNKPNEFIHKNS